MNITMLFYFFCLLIGLPSVVMFGILGFRWMRLKEKQLALEQQRLELEARKLMIGEKKGSEEPD